MFTVPVDLALWFSQWPGGNGGCVEEVGPSAVTAGTGRSFISEAILETWLKFGVWGPAFNYSLLFLRVVVGNKNSGIQMPAPVLVFWKGLTNPFKGPGLLLLRGLRCGRVRAGGVGCLPAGRAWLPTVSSGQLCTDHIVPWQLHAPDRFCAGSTQIPSRLLLIHWDGGCGWRKGLGFAAPQTWFESHLNNLLDGWAWEII